MATVTETSESIGGTLIEKLYGPFKMGSRFVIKKVAASGLITDESIIFPTEPRRIFLFVQNLHATKDLYATLGDGTGNITIKAGGYSSLIVSPDFMWHGRIALGVTIGEAPHFTAIEARIE